MRRKIRLYIADQLVDLDDQSFILFNYTMDDLANPTIVKNAYSQQITLKGTARNNRVFGGYFQTDRRNANMGGDSGVDFDASQKTPFTIYDEMGSILESGYIKLDSISRNGADIQYKVTLYGGLGSFFYALSYDDNGNKRSLADLTYRNTGSPDTELDFVINAANVEDAWGRLRGYSGTNPRWDVINFAPAYNGIPDGNFAPDKALVDPVGVGLNHTITQDDVTYTTRAGYTLINLAQAQDEWAVKDLRSYLQRPVLSMKAFWNAICNPSNNGGYQVDASVIDVATLGKYAELWLTLPMIPSIGSFSQQSGDLSVTLSSTATTGNEVGRFNIVGNVPSGTKVTANLHCKLQFNMPSGADSYSSLSDSVYQTTGRTTNRKFSAIFVQAVAYNSDGLIVGGSRIKYREGLNRYSGDQLATMTGFIPTFEADYERISLGSISKVSSGVFQIANEINFSVEAQDVAYYKILVSVYPGTSSSTDGGAPTMIVFTGDGTISTPILYADYSTGFTPNSTLIIQGTTGNTITYSSSSSLRSGATITKRMLLSTSRTPAEYMLSFCKVFGLYFTYDNASKQITLHKRNDLYQDETIDLTRRVDTSKGIAIKPLVYDSKWYDFITKGVGGAFMDEYTNIEGVQYGIQRVNTGYDFNAASVDLMNSVVFKNACTILARSRYFNIIFKYLKNLQVPQSDFTSPLWYQGTTIGGTLTRYVSVAGSMAIKMKVTPGDEFQLTARGGSAGRAWYFLDSSERIVDMSPASFNGTTDLVIPAGVSFLVAQTNNSSITLIAVKYLVFNPSPFLDKGNTYTLWTEDGDTIDTEITCPPDDSSITYYNTDPNYMGYDINEDRKLELRTKDGKPIDGTDILVMYTGGRSYDYFKLTDDVPAMDVINDGVPCWLLGAGDGAQYVPSFQRYGYNDDPNAIEDSLDFGVPRQLDIPGVTHGDGVTIYERGWKAYISDRYDVNTKVMTCRVNFAGLQVNQDLLRKFYWYDNSLWVLNAIRNYSLTTYDPVECEFVQVQDKSNYLNGQSY